MYRSPPAFAAHLKVWRKSFTTSFTGPQTSSPELPLPYQPHSPESIGLATPEVIPVAGSGSPATAVEWQIMPLDASAGSPSIAGAWPRSAAASVKQ